MYAWVCFPKLACTSQYRFRIGGDAMIAIVFDMDLAELNASTSFPSTRRASKNCRE